MADNELAPDDIFSNTAVVAPPDEENSNGATEPQELSPDDVFGASTGSGELSPHDVFGAGASDTPDMSTAGAVASGAIRGVGPLAGAIAGARLGAVGGAAVGSVVPVIGTTVGGIGGALIGAGIGGFVGSEGEEKLIQATGADQGTGLLSDKYAEAAQQQHPYWQEAGSLAPLAVAFTTGGPEVTAAARVLAGGVMGAMELGQELYNEGTFDPTKIAIAAGAGAALPSERPWLKNFGRSQVAVGAATGRPNTPDKPDGAALRTETDNANDVTAVAIGATNDNVAPTNTPVQPRQETTDGATISVVRGANDYAKSATPSAPGAPTTKSTIIETGDAPSADIQAALQAYEQSPDEIGLGNQEQTYTGTVPDRRTQQLPVTWERRAPVTPTAQQGQAGEAFQPEPPAVAENPLANAGRPAAPANTPTAHGVPLVGMAPHVQDVATLPEVQKAMVENPPKEGIPQHAIMNDGKRFDPSKALSVHDAVNDWVGNYLTERGLPEEAAVKVAHNDFAAPAEDAYYRGLGINPEDADRWWSRQNRDPNSIPAPTPEEQAAANKILTDKTQVKLPANEPSEGQNVIQPTPQPRAVELALKRLRDRGDEEAAAKLEGMSDKDAQAKAAAKINKQHTNAAGRPSIDGTQLRGSKDEVARKQSADKAYKQAYDKFKPQPDEDDEELVKRAQAAVDDAIKAHGGKNPVDKTEGYAPREKPPAWQFIKRAQELIARPTDENIERFRADEAQGWSKDVAQTKRIQSDIELTKRPTTETASAAGAGEARMEPRVSFPEVPQDTTALAEDRQALHDYINGLSDAEYNKLSSIFSDDEHPFQRVVETSSDPHRLQLQMESELDTTGLKKPGFDVAPAEESPAVIKKKITSAADLKPIKPSEGAASEGKSRKDLIDEYNKKLQAGELLPSNKSTPEERLSAAQKAAANPENLEREDMLKKGQGPAEMFPFPGGSALTSKLRKMLNGEMTAPSWWGPRVDNPLAKDADTASKDYGTSLEDLFNDYRNKSINTDSDIMDMYKKAPKDLTKDEWDEIADAIENKEEGLLPGKLKNVYDDVIKPMQKEYRSTLNHVAMLSSKEIPMQTPGVEKGFLPRLRQTDLPPDFGDDPLVRLRNLSDWDPAVADRDFVALTDQNGDRRIFKAPAEGEGNVTVWKNGAPHKYAIPNDFTGNVGDTVKLGGKDYTVDHATTPEIVANVRDENGNPLKYLTNPVIRLGEAIRGVAKVRDNLLLFQKIENDSRFKDNSTTNKDVAKANGWSLEPTKLKQFATRNGKDLYMAKPLKYAMDDYARPGLNTPAWLDNAATGLLKAMYTVGPFMHAINEADLFFIGRGIDNITPQGIQSLGRNGWKAIQSVMTQDKFQRDARAVGAPLMVRPALTRDFTRTLFKQVGEEMVKNPSVFDPVAKAFGIDVRDLAHSTYMASQNLMWTMSDILTTARIMENMDIHKMSLSDAVKDTTQFMSDYRIGGTILGSRLLSQIFSTPGLSAFGRYHAGLWRAIGMVGRKLAKGDATERMQAAGQVMAAATAAFVIYPALDKLARKITGNESASFGRRGLSAIPDIASNIVQGKKDYSALVPEIFTPSLPVNAAIEATKNLDWTGKRIIPQADLRRPANAGRAVAQAADFAGRNLVPPYSTISTAAIQPGATPATVGRKFVESQLGIRNPSAASAKYMNQIEKNNARELRERKKKPLGIVEELYNRLTN